jgi:hypothetical protein
MNLRCCALLLWTAGLALPQSQLAGTATTTTVAPGSTFGFSVQWGCAAPPCSSVAASQWTVAATPWNPTSPILTSMTAAAGTAATAAGKSIYSGGFNGAAGTETFVVVGQNQNQLQPGQIASLTATVSPTAPAGTFTLAITGPSTADPSGGTVVTTTGPPVTITIQVAFSFCDVLHNGGATPQARLLDLQAEANWLVGNPPAPTGSTPDRNGDGVGDADDGQIVANWAAGQACTAKQ